MKILSIAFKDLQILGKDRGDVFMLFLLPLIFSVVFSGALTAIGKGEEVVDVRLPLPVVDLDQSSTAQHLIDGLNAAGGVRVVSGLDQADAMQQLKDRKIDRALIIPAGFDADLSASRTVTLRLINHPDANAEQTEAVRLVVDGVARDMALEGQILAALQQMGEMQAGAPAEQQQAFGTEKVQAQARGQFAQAQTRPLVEVKQTVPAQPETAVNLATLADIAVPGMVVLFAFLTAQTTARSIYDEKKIGSFRRLLAAPLSKFELLAGKMLPNFIVAVLQAVVILAFGAFGMKLLGLKSISLGSDPLALALVIVLLALCSSALGIVIAAIARTEGQIGGIGTVLMWGMGILGGSVVPIFILERFGVLPRLIPHYWANNALDNLLVRGLGLAEVGSDLLALAGFTVLFFAIGLWKFDFD